MDGRGFGQLLEPVRGDRRGDAAPVLVRSLTPATQLYSLNVGHRDGGEGVKLEEQILITDTGIERLSVYGYDEGLLGT